MDATSLLYIAVALVAGLILFLLSQKKKPKERAPRVLVEHARADGAPVRRNVRRRVRRRDSSEEDEEDEAGSGDSDEGPKEKIGAKKAKRLAMKAEKKAEREAGLVNMEEKKKQLEAQAEQRRLDQEQEDREEEEKKEHERIEREIQEKREYEEYLLLKESFSVEGEGQDTLDEETQKNLLNEFIEHIKRVKVLQLDDLAAHYNLKIQEVVERLEMLQEDGVLTGVVDDRGKFIYISEEELGSVAKFINQNGRVSITDLAAASNRLINLEPEALQCDDLKQQELLT